MKILYIDNANGLDVQISGGLRRMIEIINRISEKNEIYLLTTAGIRENFKNSEQNNITFFIVKCSLFSKIPRIINNLPRYIYFWCLATFFSFFKINKIPSVDIFYTGSDFFCNIIPAVSRRIFRQDEKWVAMIHHKISLRKDGIKIFFTTLFSCTIQNFSFFLIRKYADRIFVYDSPMGYKIAEYFIAQGFLRSNIFFVENCVDYQYIKNIPIKDKKYEACFVGWLRLNKGIYDIVPIWKKVAEKEKQAKLVLVGDGAKNDIANIKNEIKKHNLGENIILSGPQSAERVYKFYKESKICFFPSHEEGWGIAICEAMACGLPVVAYDLEVYKNIFPKGMIRIHIGDYSGFAKAVLNLLNNRKFYQKTKSEAMEMGSKYDWNEIADKEMQIFYRIISK